MTLLLAFLLVLTVIVGPVAVLVLIDRRTRRDPDYGIEV